jgi:dihydroflavonol-4-reductase
MGAPEAGELLTENHVFNLPPDRFPYGFAKRQSQLAALKAIQPGFEVVIVNPTIVLGPGDINRISGSMLIEAARGWGFFWMEVGINAVHVNDVAAGHLAAARLGRSGERYILGGVKICPFVKSQPSSISRLEGAHPG